MEGTYPDSCTHDYIVIRDGPADVSAILDIVCGSLPSDSFWQSSSSQMLLTFVSDGEINKEGFMANYQPINDGKNAEGKQKNVESLW